MPRLNGDWSNALVKTEPCQEAINYNWLDTVLFSVSVLVGLLVSYSQLCLEQGISLA